MGKEYFSIDEDDNGTKEGVLVDAKKYKEWLDKKFSEVMDEWWEMVRMTAVSLCPVDTGTLASTIRTVIQAPSGENYEVVAGAGETQVVRMIVAGGLLINPKTGRICNYAQVVHDGYPEEGREPNPFLTSAIMFNMDTLEELLSQLVSAREFGES